MSPIEWRQKSGLTQLELAKKLEIGLRSLARYEAGGCDWPFAVLVRLRRISRGSVSYEDAIAPRRPTRHRAA
jgi:transcriptional regulator with XRE-family HTH domain